MAKAVLGRAAASRTALAAQGFGVAHPPAVTMRHFQALIDRLALIQIDSVNVAVRAHLMPAFSRLGPYPTELLDRAAGTAPRRLFEYWAHAASYVDVRLEPALRHRMAANSERDWGGIERIRRESPGLDEEVLTMVRERGPVTARKLDDSPKDKTHWGWNWSDTKHVLEYLFAAGVVSSAGRNASFERRYDVMERVIPTTVRAQPDPSAAESYLELTRRAARAMGIVSVDCLADYFRTPKAATAATVAELVSSGELEPVTVEGWKEPAFRWHEARTPRRIQGAALVSPFDNLIFHRPRALALFDLDYRIEIYVPAAKRRFGYYVYPLLVDGRFVGRFDIASRRAQGRLVVAAAWREPGATMADADIAEHAADQLRSMAGWLGLGEVEVSPRGDLHEQLSKAL